MISILGDSISTFAGCNPEGYAVYYDSEMQQKNGLRTAEDTWWEKVIRALDDELLVNNAWSGSRVSGAAFPSAFSEERLQGLQSDGKSPDIILIYIGFNDFGDGIPVSSKKRGLIKRRNVLCFEDAYEQMLLTIKKQYPLAKIICGTLLRTKIRNQKDWKFPEAYRGIPFEEYNHAIRRVCRRRKCMVADLAQDHVAYETLDGSHPTREGHQVIAELWCRCLHDLGMLQLLFGKMQYLDHPNILRYEASIVKENRRFRIDDASEGKSLSGMLMREGRFCPDVVIQWALQLCDIYHYLYALSPPLFHTRIALSNFLIYPDNKLKILFENGDLLDVENRTFLPRGGNWALNLFASSGMAPEAYLIQGNSKITEKTSVYSVGSFMYCLLTGKHPSDTEFVIWPIGELVSEYAGTELEKIVIKCCEPNPDLRYQDCNELMGVLQGILQK